MKSANLLLALMFISTLLLAQRDNFQERKEYFDHEQFESMMESIHEQIRSATDSMAEFQYEGMEEAMSALDQLRDNGHWEAFNQGMEQFHIGMDAFHENMEDFHIEMEGLQEHLHEMHEELQDLHHEEWQDIDWGKRKHKDKEKRKEKSKGLKKIN